MKYLDKRYPPGGVSPIYIYIYILRTHQENANKLNCQILFSELAKSQVRKDNVLDPNLYLFRAPVGLPTRGLHPGFLVLVVVVASVISANAQCDWTTGVPDNGNEWRKFSAVPRLYPLRSLVFHIV